MTNPKLPTDITEDLLHGLIAECGAMIRAQVRQRITVEPIQRLSPSREGEG